jgi:hypothetical protein
MVNISKLIDGRVISDEARLKRRDKVVVMEEVEYVFVDYAFKDFAYGT